MVNFRINSSTINLWLPKPFAIKTTRVWYELRVTLHFNIVVYHCMNLYLHNLVAFINRVSRFVSVMNQRFMTLLAILIIIEDKSTVFVYQNVSNLRNKWHLHILSKEIVRSTFFYQVVYRLQKFTLKMNN